MTYTYNLVAPFNDITRIRFHIRDTDSTAIMYQDEELTFILSESGGDYKHAVIMALEGKIAELANIPDFSKGMLRVSYAVQMAQLQKLLTMKRQEFDIALVTATASYIYRPDNTGFTQAPTFMPDVDDLDLDGDDD